MISQQTEHHFSYNSEILPNSKDAVIVRVTTSSLIYDKPCILLECGGEYLAGSQYVSPTGIFLGGDDWDNAEKVYDGNDLTAATVFVDAFLWSSPLGLELADEILISGVRFWAPLESQEQDGVALYYYDNDDIVLIYTGFYNDFQWTTVNTDSYVRTKKLLIKFFNQGATRVTQYLYEVEFIHRKFLEAEVYDGFSTDGTKKIEITPFDATNSFKYYPQPVVFTKGLYVNFVEDFGSVFFRYVPLRCL